MEAQDEIFFGGQRSMDPCGSRYCKCRNVTKIIGKVGSEGLEKNLVVSLRFNIIKCPRGRYNKGIMG
jgi:hypothetical protein